MDLTELKETFDEKLKEFRGIPVEDQGFKDASTAICNLAETTSKLENVEKEQELKKEENKLKKLDAFAKLGLGVATGIIVPVVINTLNHMFKRDMAHESWTYEKDGVVMSPTSKNFVNDSFKDDKQ